MHAVVHGERTLTDLDFARLKTGDLARWHTPSGEECTSEIASIQYQPEASGDYSR
ncbi:hypothetical protein QTI17_33370 [Variovorax sp. J31P179]|jgi:hypothetical protein|uniref:hypothetical protein n=1 Tax=Variovorax sp. J31P179 TaxID=3053508 RepID=UPI002577169C|nr:hypothetical protein [Variovorax sp. J31P179]MDM0085492.1 hypothetical protein [Variovorax sp. J31P179]